MTRTARHLSLIIAFSLLFALPVAAAGPQFAGHWEGAIALPNGALTVIADLREDGGTIVIPQQAAKQFALTVSREGEAIIFAIQDIPGSPTFRGTLSPDGAKLSGTFTQSGQSYPFALDRKEPAAASADALKGFDTFVESLLAPWDVPGAAVAIVRGDQVIFAKGFGSRDVQGKLPVTADTLFPIGSSTKAFTTFALGTLVDEGKLDWTKPVRSYIPGFQMYDPIATLELTPVDLVTHRSGLPRHDLVWYNNQDLSRKEIVERVRFLPPSAELRQKFQYNNLMYLTAGYLVEQLTGLSWEEALRQRIFEPLGMTRTNFANAVSQKDADFARPYRMDHEKLLGIPFREVGNMGPAGSISSSVKEMARWMIVHLNDGKYNGRQIIQPATMQMLHTPQMFIPALPTEAESSTASYAMGWFVTSHRGHLEVSHGGNIDGFSALVTLFPFDSTGIVVLTNGDGNPLPSLITNHAADRLFALSSKDWAGEALVKRNIAKAADKEAEKKKAAYRRSGTKPSHPLDDYAGEYAHPGYGAISVTRKGDALQAEYNHIATPLEHWHYDVFNGKKAADPVFEDTKYLFRADTDGNIAALEVPFELLLPPLRFEKLPDSRLSDPQHLQQFLGTYEIGPQMVKLSLQGNRMIASIAGQPPYELVPAVGGWFDLKGLTGFRVRLEPDARSGVMTMIMHQPNGVYTAVKK